MARNPYAFEGFQMPSIGEALARGQRYRINEQASQIAQEQAAQARAQEAAAAKLRPLKQLGEEIAIRGQIIGAGETADDYLAVLPMLKEYGLPTADLPELRSTASETFRARPEAPKVAPAWMPKGWLSGAQMPGSPLMPIAESSQNNGHMGLYGETATPKPAWMPEFGVSLPASEAAPRDLPTETMVNPLDLQAIQRRAQIGLPLEKQEKFKDADVGRQIQLATLSRLREKDELSQRWMDFQREAKIQGMTEAETQRAFQREMARLGYNLDIAKFTFQKDIETGKANTAKNPNEGQSKAAMFGRQVFEGKQELDSLLGEGFDPTSVFDATGSLLAGTAFNSLASEKAQLWKQAVDRITNAALRFESGAAIGDQEAARKIRETIPKLGDSPAVVKSKMRTIEGIISGLEVAAGPAGASVRGSGKSAAGTKPAASSDAPPVSVLREGVGKKFPNGQVWTLRNGQAVRVQ